MTTATTIETVSQLTTAQQLTEFVDQLDTDATQDVMLAVEDRIAYIKQSAKELDGTFKKRMYDWIEVNGEISLPALNLRWYNAITKRTKANDNGKLLEALFQTTGGDVDQFVKCLSSNAFKQGECRHVLGDEDWAKHFTVTEIEDVKTGKPKRETKKVDTRFLTKKGAK